MNAALAVVLAALTTQTPPAPVLANVYTHTELVWVGPADPGDNTDDFTLSAPGASGAVFVACSFSGLPPEPAMTIPNPVASLGFISARAFNHSRNPTEGAFWWVTCLYAVPQNP